MADQDFALNLMKMLASEMHFQNTMLASREMFGRGYFSLGMAEKIAVDQAVIGHVGSYYRDITPEILADTTARQPMGFGTHKPESTPSSETGA